MQTVVLCLFSATAHLVLVHRNQPQACTPDCYSLWLYAGVTYSSACFHVLHTRVALALLVVTPRPVVDSSGCLSVTASTASFRSAGCSASAHHNLSLLNTGVACTVATSSSYLVCCGFCRTPSLLTNGGASADSCHVRPFSMATYQQ